MTIAMFQLYRLLGRFEKGPHDDAGCRLTAEGAALDAYLCSANKPTLAFGCTYHPDGTPVKMGDSITEAEVYPYTEAAVERVVSDLKRIVKRPLNEYQTAALCSFIFNLGGTNLADSQRLLPAVEAGRWEDAAEYMGEFIRAWGKLEGKWHRKAERGLLIRRYAEGCLLLGLDWEPWCNTNKIVLHEKLLWQPDWVDPKGVRKGGRWFDEVQPTTTPFHIIEDMARSTPLPSLEITLTPSMQAAPPTSPATAPEAKGAEAVPAQPAQPQSSPKVSPAPTVPPVPPAQRKPEAIPAPPAPRANLPAPIPPSPGQQREGVNGSTTPGIDPSSPKSMLLSRRFWGLLMIIVGRVVFVFFGADTMLKLGSDPLVSEMISNVMVMLVASAWEYCGEMLHTWGKVKAKRALK